MTGWFSKEESAMEQHLTLIILIFGVRHSSFLKLDLKGSRAPKIGAAQGASILPALD